ncbi:hypothetical protein CCM_00398 [Cordyceps militaris CM01]|uniref:Uncharacterized protein n=1 Tax=Cordyceps militaris (strain CM01) TaxID=983644 RepID=G3J3W9_CORMM|nr:uncharacterized protein CCM_00398 [Cordyceps militaris CM01]EGX95744.1 hypothetical protein CCM_00398 [Cordyceps militaris CM01]
MCVPVSKEPVRKPASQPAQVVTYNLVQLHGRYNRGKLFIKKAIYLVAGLLTRLLAGFLAGWLLAGWLVGFLAESAGDPFDPDIWHYFICAGLAAHATICRLSMKKRLSRRDIRQKPTLESPLSSRPLLSLSPGRFISDNSFIYPSRAVSDGGRSGDYE